MTRLDSPIKSLSSYPMKTTFDEFRKMTTEEWLEKVRADLKDRDVASTVWDYDESLRISPFAGPTTNDARMSSVSRGSWQTGACFSARPGSEQETNNQLLQCLAGGVNAIHLTLKDAVDLERVFRDVMPDMIHVTFDLTDSNKPDRIAAHVRDFLQMTTHSSVSLRGATNFEGFPGTVNVDDSQTVIHGLTAAMKETIHLAEKTDALDFAVHIGTAYFVEIARLRALRILLENVKISLDREFADCVEVHFSDDALEEDVHQNMIRASSMTLSAIIGGADRVYTKVRKDPNDETDDERRIARNMHHLLQYETDIPEVVDPVRGSYYLEGLTRKMVESVWETLI